MEQTNWPFKKISGKNGELFHLEDKPFLARVHEGLEIAINDTVEYHEEDENGNILSQLGKVLNIFFLESTEAIIAQIEREPDKEIVALEVQKIQRNISHVTAAVSAVTA